MTQTLPTLDADQLPQQESAAAIAGQWAPVFKALGDPIRLEIVLLLTERSRSVKELQTQLKINQALVSHHLRLLREQGFVTSTAQGRSNIYRICVESLACLAQCMTSMVNSTDGACSCTCMLPSA